MSAVCHFEIPADNVEKVKDFYTKLFGWKIEKCDKMDYWMISTGKDSKGKEGMSGGLMKKQCPEQMPVNYVEVECVDTYLKKAEELGAKIAMKKTPVPGAGAFGIIADIEGNALGVWENDPNAKCCEEK